MAGNDLVKQMAECLQVVQDSKNKDERLEALDTLQDMCEDMDLANGVYRYYFRNSILKKKCANCVNLAERRASSCSIVFSSTLSFQTRLT